MEDFVDNVIKNNSEIENGKWVSEEKLKQRELLTQITQQDEELGLYDEPFDNPLVKEQLTTDENISDWDITLMDGLEDEEPFFTEEEIEKILQEEPTEEEIERNFFTIEPEIENIFQEEDNWTPELEQQYWEEQVLEPFTTEEELKIDITPTNEPQIEISNEEPIKSFEEDNQRMDIIGQNGNEGLHYDNEENTSSEQDDEKKN
jgi:hypothetical protein